jgi:hypothetical protein
MMHHYAYSNAKLNSLLQQKGNGTMSTIKWTPLKTNNPTVTANKVDGPAARDAIAVCIGKKKSKNKKKKTTKEKEDKDAADYKKRLDLCRKITKINLLIPQVMDGYCNIRKIPNNYRSTVKYRVTKNYNGCILRRCSDHGLTRDTERRFTPKPCDFNYAEKNPETDKKTEQHSTDGYLSYQSSDSIDSEDTSTTTISADNGANNADDGAIVSTGYAAEKVVKEASDNFNAIQNTNVNFNLV